VSKHSGALAVEVRVGDDAVVVGRVAEAEQAGAQDEHAQVGLALICVLEPMLQLPASMNTTC